MESFALPFSECAEMNTAHHAPLERAQTGRRETNRRQPNSRLITERFVRAHTCGQRKGHGGKAWDFRLCTKNPTQWQVTVFPWPITVSLCPLAAAEVCGRAFRFAAAEVSFAVPISAEGDDG
ncbi:hypothetical protein H8E77_08890 [bacterium]|nr:hypothetical protein [bacterium]